MGLKWILVVCILKEGIQRISGCTIFSFQFPSATKILISLREDFSQNDMKNKFIHQQMVLIKNKWISEWKMFKPSRDYVSMNMLFWIYSCVSVSSGGAFLTHAHIWITYAHMSIWVYMSTCVDVGCWMLWGAVPSVLCSRLFLNCIAWRSHTVQQAKSLRIQRLLRLLHLCALCSSTIVHMRPKQPTTAL